MIARSVAMVTQSRLLRKTTALYAAVAIMFAKIQSQAVQRVRIGGAHEFPVVPHHIVGNRLLKSMAQKGRRELRVQPVAYGLERQSQAGIGTIGGGRIRKTSKMRSTLRRT